MDSIWYVGFFALGAVIASFTGVIAERIHTGESWMRGRSQCNSCAVPLRALDLVPVVSWLIFKGKCARCGSHVPFLYPAFEFVLGAVFLLAYAMHGFTYALIPFLLAVALLAFIVLYDLRHTVVPQVASSLLVVLSLLYAFLVTPSYAALGLTLMTAGVITLFFLSLHVFSGGRAMGLGDAPVALGLSLLVAPYAVAGLLFSFWTGALFGIAVLVRRRQGPRMGIEVPFVPFLALGFLLAYFIQWNPLALY